MLNVSVQETYGEDPYLSGELVSRYVKGLQGDDPRYVRANAGCKHFAVYAGPEDIPSSRFSFDAKVQHLNLPAVQFAFSYISFSCYEACYSVCYRVAGFRERFTHDFPASVRSLCESRHLQYHVQLLQVWLIQVLKFRCSILPVGGMAQWLGCRSLAGGLSLPCT